MSLDSLTSMFSQRTGAQQSVSGSVMNAIIGYLMQNMMQKGVSSFLGGGGGQNNTKGIQSALSGLGNLNQDHALVQNVQQNAGIQDPNQATEYTRHGVNLLSEQANSNPQGIQSLLSGFLGGGGGIGNSSEHQQTGDMDVGGSSIRDTLGF